MGVIVLCGTEEDHGGCVVGTPAAAVHVIAVQLQHDGDGGLLGGERRGGERGGGGRREEGSRGEGRREGRRGEERRGKGRRWRGERRGGERKTCIRTKVCM